MAQFNGPRIEWGKVSFALREGTYTSKTGRESQWVYVDIVQGDVIVESKLLAPVRKDAVRALHNSMPAMRESLKAIYATAPEPVAPAAPAAPATPDLATLVAQLQALGVKVELPSAPAAPAPTPPAAPKPARNGSAKPAAPAAPKSAEAELEDLPFD